jgi:hypothetical protein
MTNNYWYLGYHLEWYSGRKGWGRESPNRFLRVPPGNPRNRTILQEIEGLQCT